MWTGNGNLQLTFPTVFEGRHEYLSLQIRELRHREVKGLAWDPTVGCGELRSMTEPTLFSWKASSLKYQPWNPCSTLKDLGQAPQMGVICVPTETSVLIPGSPW